jgi:hypothetical protein
MIALTLSLVACLETGQADRVEPTFLEVVLDSSVEPGTLEEPLPFSSEPTTVALSVTALDRNADPVDFTGTLTLNVRPGSLENLPWIEMDGSSWSGSVSFRNGFGPTRIWVSDEGDLDIESPRQPSFAAGVSEPLFYEIPTLSELNTHEDPEKNQLDGEFAEVKCEGQDVRISAVGTNGFWATDMADAPSSYNSLFVYTFSKPQPEVVVGAQLGLLTGNDQEYLGTTQFSFPTYEVTDEPTVEPPTALEITSDHCDSWKADANALEPMESALVTINAATVPSSFVEGDEDFSDYENYKQWPVQVVGGDCTFFVSSKAACPLFQPTANDNYASVTGMLNQVWDKWILVVRSSDDLPEGVCDPTAGGPPPQLPPRPRPSLLQVTP